MAKLFRYIFVFTILTLTIEGNYDDQEKNNGGFGYVLKLLRDHPEEYREFWQKIKVASQGKIHDTEKFIPRPYDDACTECGAGLDALIQVVSTVPIIIVKPLITELCVSVLNSQGANGTILCPTVIDNYINHIYFIFSSMNRTGEEACKVLNNCYSPLLTANSFVNDEKFDFFEQFARALKPVHINILPQIPRRFQRGRNKNVIKVAHFTDVHVEERYVVGSPTQCDLYVCCQNEGVGTGGSAHPYGDFNCNIPPITVEKFLDFIASQNPDIVMYTGDSPPHSLWTETLEGQRDVSKWVAEAITQHMPGVPAYPAFGNHECFPSNLFYGPDPDVQVLTQAYYDTWKDLSGFGVEQESTIKTAGHYAVDTPIDGLKIISVNGNYGYTNNWYNLINDVEPAYIKMKQDIEQAFEEAVANDQKVLFLHHFNAGGGVVGYDEWVSQVSVTYKDVILFAVSGHTHRNLLHITSDPVTGTPALSHFTASSVDSHGGKNPGIRIFHLDAATLTPLDYEQYRIDVPQLVGNPTMEPNVTLLYKFSEAYGVNDLTPASLKNLVDKFETDDELFNKYISHQTLRPESAGVCEGACKHNTICSIKSSNWLQKRECEDEWDTGSGTEPDTTTTGTEETSTTVDGENSTPGGGETTTTSGSEITTEGGATVSRGTWSTLAITLLLIFKLLK